jgi:archaemetzincin
MTRRFTFLWLIVSLAGISYVLHGTTKCSGKMAFSPDADDHFTIQIQPFDDFPASQSQYVYHAVKKLYANTVLLKPVKLPARSYYKPRNRYRADSIIGWLSDRTPGNNVTLGLTSKDISTKKDKIVDWGVMGLGFQPGNACVVSTFRLNKKNLLDQLFKVSVHELGHTQGLEHCENKTCFMRDAEGHNTTDEEHEFCRKCKKRLEDKGWVFPN